jgi:hypothetical protein
MANVMTFTDTMSYSLPGSATFSFNEFDSSLGTLNGISLNVASSYDDGSFVIQTGSRNSQNITVTGKDTLHLVDNQGSGASYTFAPTTLSASPSFGSVHIDRRPATITFTLAANQFLTTALGDSAAFPENIDPSYFSLYESPGGSGTVSFSTSNDAAGPITIVGNQISIISDSLENTTELDLTYTFTPSGVPEPSQYGVFAFLAMLSLTAWRKFRRPTA